MAYFRAWTSGLCVLLWGLLSLAAAASTYYTLSDFQWYVKQEDGRKQRTALLQQLSRRQIVVVVVWAETAERDRKLQAVQAFFQQPRPALPTLRQIETGPSGVHFASYVVTTVEDQSLAGVAVLLNTFQGFKTFDYALPVLQLRRGAVIPFVEFSAVFAASSGPHVIADFVRRQPVIVLRQSGSTYTMRLRSGASTNILAVIRAFEEAADLVKEVRPVWLDMTTSQSVNLSALAPQEGTSPAKTAPVLPDIAARVTLDTGWDFPLVNVREPITYRLHIERQAQALVLSESLAPSALRRILARVNRLPAELFDVTEAGKETASLSDERVQQRVDYTLRFSKPGTYRIPALQIVYTLEKSRRTSRRLQSTPEHGYLVTVDAHLPPGTPPLPGHILAPPRMLWQPRPWLRYVAFGMVAVGGGMCVIGILRRRPRPRRSRQQAPLSLRQLRQKYQDELQPLRHHVPPMTADFSAEQRAWLRDCAALVRRFLGEWASGDATLFAGGAGVSAAVITAHLQTVIAEQDTVFEPVLHLLHELDIHATAPASLLALEDYHRFSDAVEHVIRLLTTREAPRVLRPLR